MTTRHALLVVLDDREFAALAYAAGAVLVSSDDHLLSADVPGLRVVTPGQFRRGAGD